jgi:ferredoxin-NADP reductase
MKLTLTKKYPETADVVTFWWKPSEPLQWQAGQYLRYKLPHLNPDDRGESRFFTIASAPSEGHVQITTRLAERRGSTFKEALNQLRVGDSIQAGPVGGDFVINDLSRDYVLVAGGIGITPFRAILKELNYHSSHLRGTLLYANRDEQPVFRNELETIAASMPDFKIRYFIGQSQIDQTALVQAGSHLQNPLYYLSGPEPMVKHFESLLEAAGVPAINVRTDYFPGYQT